MATFVKNNSRSSFANNWIAHICIIIILIISFVLYDKIASRKPSSPAITKNVPLTQKNPETAYNPPPIAETVQKTKETTNIEAESAEDIPAEKSAKDSAPAIATETKPDITEKNTKQNGIKVSFYKITKQALIDLQKVSRAVNTSGESVAGTVSSRRLASVITSGEMQYIVGSAYKDFDETHPTMIFKGNRHAEAGRNMGLSFLVNLLRKTETAHVLEVKGWGALKTNDPDENYFTTELMISPNTAAFIANFLPRSTTYREDEKQIFEKDRLLKTLNQDDFNDGTTDIIMFIEFNKRN